jgi:type I site-specific deoxyribonuclease
MQEVVCMAVLSKRQMSEEDIKFHYITPAITAKWDKQHITLETKITYGYNYFYMEMIL